MKCQEKITRGKNKGKLCYEVNKYCNIPAHKTKETSYTDIRCRY